MDQPASEKDATNVAPVQVPSADQLDLFRRREYILKLIKGLPGDRLEAEPEELMNGAEVRAFLPCSIRRMYQFINAGLLHQVRRERYQAYYLRSEVEALKRDLDGPGADVTSLRELVRRLVLSINVDLVAATGGRVTPERRPTWDQVVELRDAVRSQHAKAMEGHTHASIRPPTV